MGAAAPLPPPPRPVLLLFPLGSSASAAPADLPEILTRRLADALRRAGLLNVVVVRDGTAPPTLPPGGEAPPAAEHPAGDTATLSLSPELVRLVRTERATHLMTGGVSEYVPAADRMPGRVSLRLMLVTVDGKGRREGSVSVRLPRRPKSAAVADALALTAGQLARTEFAPILAVTAPTEPKGVAALLARGREAMEAGDLEEARRRFDAALAEAPRDPRVNAALGDLLLRLNRPAAAASRYRQSLLFDPADATVRRQLLRALDRHGDRGELARAAQEAIDAGSVDAEVWRTLGIGTLAQGLTAAAEAALSESQSREPAAGETIRARAFLLAITGRPAEAARLLEPSAREGDPDREALLERIKALPGDPISQSREPLPAPETLLDLGSIRGAGVAAIAQARLLLAEGEVLAGESGRRRTLAAASAAHALAAWWGRVPKPETARAMHESVEGALAAVARVSVASAVAADRPWPGAAALIARLRDAAQAALRAAEGTADGTNADPDRAAAGSRRPGGDGHRATGGRRGEGAAGRRGDPTRQLHVLLPDRDRHRR